jgi:tetratricopeptide (TPR) repeat protein
MLHRDGRVLVTDFGLVRGDETSETPGAVPASGELGENLTQIGAVLGTPGYMPPEQSSGRQTDARTDQFSFCVSLWEALYGLRPFAGASTLEVEHAILAGSLTEGDAPPIPAWLRAVIVRGLASAPADRWPSMHELLAALTQDPTPRRRVLQGAAALLGVGLGLAGALLVTSARAQAATSAECARSGQEIDALWNDTIAAAMQRRFLATGVHEAAAHWSRAQPWMDAYTQEWAAQRTRTCLDARVEGHLDAASHAASAACLDERRAAISGVLDVWAEVDDKTLRMATTAAAGLPPLSMCSDQTQLGRVIRPAPAIRLQVQALQLRVERIKAMRLAGAYEAALAGIEALRPEAEAIGWRPLIAQVQLEIGFDQADLGRYDAARKAAESSFVDAAGSGDELGMLYAASKLSHTVGNLLGQIERGHLWGEIALALLTRLGMEGSVAEASLRNSIGSVHLKAAAYEPALACYRRSLAIYEATLGPHHPSVATSSNNIATALRNQGQYTASLAPYQRALQIHEAALGPDHPAVGFVLHGLGLSQLALADLVHARANLERAVAIRERAGEPGKLAASRYGLAKVLWATGERDQAHALAQTARDGFRGAGPGYARELVKVEVWLTEHNPGDAVDSTRSAEPR